MPSLLYLVKQLELAVRARLDEVVRGHGVTALQYTALTVLERHDGLSAAQLARDSFVTAQSIADMVRTLETRGLIRRERNTENRRELLIHLTGEGRALLAAVDGPVRDLEARMITKLTDAQSAGFRHSLTTAWQSLS
ncbi:MarR family transcriptional regulator [Actinoplanes sp. NEAU-A12]|uniref:MarR family transcriptional regulator n=1 Tax=Actinoplanes sandaracinus TaxID=3045177 RepID=A0ABT6WUN6_9ACTN|nr:MarR family transcriptional regulator [Actinoplanes sandaracinus]MDI6103463.1 MarR family transcriptional regulator [Actinoplanes sandaracinus]